MLNKVEREPDLLKLCFFFILLLLLRFFQCLFINLKPWILDHPFRGELVHVSNETSLILYHHPALCVFKCIFHFASLFIEPTHLLTFFIPEFEPMLICCKKLFIDFLSCVEFFVGICLFFLPVRNMHVKWNPHFINQELYSFIFFFQVHIFIITIIVYDFMLLFFAAPLYNLCLKPIILHWPKYPTGHSNQIFFEFPCIWNKI
mmetsp:Transcript_26247/g.34488  ORF Transcript_26247/g.34488 Transcript_26247/m.34488 type:complete len:203 (-) Transcript_26247:973-1581(-)